jgi:predicted GIY-YIG superfamily endonuclease
VKQPAVYILASKPYGTLYETMLDAIQREKRVKKWNRAWKLELIEEANPLWADLAEQAF